MGGLCKATELCNDSKSSVSHDGGGVVQGELVLGVVQQEVAALNPAKKRIVVDIQADVAAG